MDDNLKEIEGPSQRGAIATPIRRQPRRFSWSARSLTNGLRPTQKQRRDKCYVCSICVLLLPALSRENSFPISQPQRKRAHQSRLPKDELASIRSMLSLRAIVSLQSPRRPVGPSSSYKGPSDTYRLSNARRLFLSRRTQMRLAKLRTSANSVRVFHLISLRKSRSRKSNERSPDRMVREGECSKSDVSACEREGGLLSGVAWFSSDIGKSGPSLGYTEPLMAGPVTVSTT